MASQSYTATGTYPNLYLQLDLSSTKDVANNRSTVSYNLYLVKPYASGAYNFSYGNSCKLILNGTTLIDTGNIRAINITDLPAGSTIPLTSGSIVVDHNADGTKTIPVYARFFQTQTSLVDFDCIINSSFTLDTIPRASMPSVSSSSADIGTSVTIYTNRASSSFTHTLQYKVGNGSYTNIATGVTASQSWTLPASIYSEIPSASSAAITIKCITYNGGTEIGQATCTMTATVPSGAVPSLSQTISDGKNILSGVLVQRLSTIKVVSSGSSSYGATISGYSTTITRGGTVIGTWAGATIETGIINTAGNYTISTTVTDSRGKTTTQTQAVTVYAYTSPSASNISAIRSDSGGTAQYDGTYAKVTFTYTVPSVVVSGTEKLTASIHVYYKLSSSGTWTEGTAQSVTPGTTATFTHVYGSGSTFSPDSTYNFKIVAAVSIGSTEYIYDLPGAAIPLDINEDGTALGLLAPADTSNAIRLGRQTIGPFGNEVLIGSRQANATTLPDLVDELRYSNGGMGSVNIETAYSTSITTGWYFYLWIPHRSGGFNGAASGDNCDNGLLLLHKFSADELYIIRYTGGSIQSVVKVTTAAVP